VTVDELIMRLFDMKIAGRGDLEVKAPGPPPDFPFPFDGGIADVTPGENVKTGQSDILLIPDVSG